MAELKEEAMGRSNTPESLENWNRNERSLPFRASISSNCHWYVGRPPPYLIGASRVCRGGRMILAFDLAETRDYFVEGHADQGAQAEDDFCPVASPRRQAPPKRPLSQDYATARNEVAAALSLYDLARKQLEEAFLPDVMRLLADNRPREAMALARSMPTDSVEKTVAMTRISQSVKLDSDLMRGIDGAPYDSRRAVAMFEWQKAHNERERLEGPFTVMAVAKAKQVLAEDGHDALLSMIMEMPPIVSKAHLVMFARKNAPVAGATRASGPRP